MNALNIARKDLQIFFRDRGAVIQLFLLPLVFVIVFSGALAALGGDGEEEDARILLPVVDLDASELHEWDMKPFKMAIENGAEAVMTSHVLYSQLDSEYPATLSSQIIHGILREQYGFQGVIISDGIAMGALSNNYDITETLRLSFKAGIDLILVHSKYDLSDMKKKVYRLYRKGEITEEEINEGVRRVLELKLKYGLLPDTS